MTTAPALGDTAARPTAKAVAPHGGLLVLRLALGQEAEALAARAETLPKVTLDARALADAELIATGALSPLDGFVGAADYRAIVKDMRLQSGAVFSIPITLVTKDAPREGSEVALQGEDGALYGTMQVREVYELDRDLEAREVYRTTDPAHPGVAYLKQNEGRALGGPIQLFRLPTSRFPAHHRTPAQLRAEIARRGWKKTVAFQTRNPVHRAHEYLLRSALETVDGLVIHPLVGETKGDDVPAAVRVRCYETLLERYFPKDRALLSVFPFAMRYAGPREAVLHAIARQNYGFSHFIVGRDHAGVRSYYGTYDAQKIFDQVRPGELAIETLFFEHSFYCNACKAVASLKTCPHAPEDRLVLSGTRVRQMLSAGEALPEEFTRPEIAAILAEAYRGGVS